MIGPNNFLKIQHITIQKAGTFIEVITVPSLQYFPGGTQRLNSF